MAVISTRSTSLSVDPPGGSDHLTAGGSDWLWAVFALYLVAFLITLGLGASTKHGELIFHYIFALALFVGAISYFAMAADLGFSVVVEEFHRLSSYQVFYVKYIFWAVAFPLVTTALSLASCISWATILYNVFLSWIWVICFLCAALISTSYKWGFFTFGFIAYLLLAYQLLGPGHLSASNFGLSKHYLGLSGGLTVLLFLYVIAFAVSDGAQIITVTSSFIFFGILDLLLLPVFALAFLYLAPRWDYQALNLNFTRYGRVRGTPGQFPEKENRGTGVAGHHTTPAGNSGYQATAPNTATDTQTNPVQPGYQGTGTAPVHTNEVQPNVAQPAHTHGGVQNTV